MKAWRGTDGDVAPVPVECEVFGYPHRTTDGDTMYENTHFRTEAEAWDSVLRSVDAWVSLAGGSVARATESLRSANEDAGRAAEAWRQAREGHRAFLRREADRIKAELDAPEPLP